MTWYVKKGPLLHYKIYTVRFKNAVYVLHCFQKKSKQGIETPQQALDLIESRLKQAEQHSKGKGK